MLLGSGTQAITLNKQWIACIFSVSVCVDMIERGERRGRMDLTPTIFSLGGNAEETVVTDWFRSVLSPLKEAGVSVCGLMFFKWQQPCCCAETAEPISTSTTAFWPSFCQERYFVEGMKLGWFPGPGQALLYWHDTALWILWPAKTAELFYVSFVLVAFCSGVSTLNILVALLWISFALSCWWHSYSIYLANIFWLTLCWTLLQESSLVQVPPQLL